MTERMQTTVLAGVVVGIILGALGLIGWIGTEIFHDFKEAATERQQIRDRLSRLEGAMWGDSSRGDGATHR